MKKKYWFALAALGAAVSWPAFVQAAPVLSQNDFIIAIDGDPNVALSLSDYPGDADRPAGNEQPFKAIDGSSGTKYLNFGELNTGFIVTPGLQNTTVQSIRFTTANDAEARDPASWVLEGSTQAYTQAELTAVDNNNGLFGTWTPIASGDVTMPAARLTQMDPIPFSNTTAYNSYRIRFPTVKNAAAANSMQIAEVALLQSNGLTIFDEFGGDATAAFHLAPIVPDSRYNAGEGPIYLLDGSGPNPSVLQSRYPTVPPNANYEGPNNLVDGNVATKYLNFGKVDSGFIIQPAGGASQVRSFTLTTANDAVGRDPTDWQLFGTNAPITSLDNSYGTAETWTPIDSGIVALPAERGVLGPVVTVNNPSSYTAYKMLFTGLKDTLNVDSMQIAEAAFFTSPDGSGPNILSAPTTILAVDGTVTTGLQTKYLNFGKNNSGVIVTPAAGAKAVTALQITTANDFPERDPASYQIYGTNATIVSGENSQGAGETWTLIASGNLTLPADRFTAGDVVTFENATAYTSYKVVFPTVKDAPLANGMQISGLQLFDNAAASNADFDGNGIVDGNDFLKWQRGLGMTSQTNNQNGDANGDGSVTAADLAIWKTKFGGPGATAAASAVPEPASFAMLGLGLLAGGTLVRTSRRS
jgi:hypothetical protein